MSRKPIDFEALRRAITMGSTEAAKDAGLVNFAISVDIRPAVALTPAGPVAAPLIEVEIAEISDEEAQGLARGLPS